MSFGFSRALAVADAVEAREIGRALRRGDDVIDRDRVLRVRQRDLDDLRALAFVFLDGGAHRLLHLGVDALDEIFLRHAEAQPLHAPM